MSGQLAELVTDDRIRLRVDAGSWEAAVAAAAEPLVADGSIDAAYVDAIVAAALEYGPYFVLVPSVALAHARPDGSVHRLAISVATIDPPVAFGSEDNDPVGVVVCLAAPDADTHLEALRSLVAIIGDPERVARIEQATSVAELRGLLTP